MHFIAVSINCILSNDTHQKVLKFNQKYYKTGEKTQRIRNMLGVLRQDKMRF